MDLSNGSTFDYTEDLKTQILRRILACFFSKPFSTIDPSQFSQYNVTSDVIFELVKEEVAAEYVRFSLSLSLSLSLIFFSFSSFFP